MDHQFIWNISIFIVFCSLFLTLLLIMFLLIDSFVLIIFSLLKMFEWRIHLLYCFYILSIILANKYILHIRIGTQEKGVEYVYKASNKDTTRKTMTSFSCPLELTLKHQPYQMSKYIQTICLQQRTICLSVFDQFVGWCWKG